MRDLSENQLRVISYIEDNLKIKFKGTTSKDARIFISNNIEESKNKHKDNKSEAIDYIFNLIINKLEFNKEELDKLLNYKKLFK